MEIVIISIMMIIIILRLMFTSSLTQVYQVDFKAKVDDYLTLTL